MEGVIFYIVGFLVASVVFWFMFEAIDALKRALTKERRCYCGRRVSGPEA